MRIHHRDTEDTEQKTIGCAQLTNREIIQTTVFNTLRVLCVSVVNIFHSSKNFPPKGFWPAREV